MTESARERWASFRDGAEEYARSILVAVLFALFVKTHLFQAFRIPSPSMEPGLLAGDHVLVDKLVYAAHRGPWRVLLPYRDPQPGDVAVFKAPSEPTTDLIKRVVGMPGDRVEIRAKAFVRNGELQAEAYAVHSDPVDRSGVDDIPESARRRDAWGPAIVPRASYFALGDNRDDSADSRFWGYVPSGLLRGRALLVYWSIEPGERARSRGGWTGRMRWSRTLHRVR